MLKILQARLVLEKAEEPEIKLPTSVGSSKNQESSRKISTSYFIDYAKAFDCVDHNKLWKILRDGNTRPPDLPLEKSVCRSGSNSQNWTWNNRFVIHRERSTSRLILSPCLFNFYADYIMRNSGLEEAQAGIKMARRNINNLRYADDTTLMEKREEALNSILMKVKEE